MFKLGLLSVNTFALIVIFQEKRFKFFDQNFFGLLILSFSAFLWWFDFAFLIFLLHLFLKVSLDFLAFLNVTSLLFINFLVSISSHGHGLLFRHFSVWGACVSKASCKEDVKYFTA